MNAPYCGGARRHSAYMRPQARRLNKKCSGGRPFVGAANRSVMMKTIRNGWALLLLATIIAMSTPLAAQQQQKPNIVVIMGDDIGMWNIGAYHRGMMAGRTPN